jgi:preprotein translocase subunit YajC
MDMMMTLIPFVILIVLWYVMLIRPQQKKQKEVTKMRDSLRPGDEVVTIGGFMARVVKTRDDIVVLELNDKTRVNVKNWAIGEKLNLDEEEEEVEEVESEAEENSTEE